MATNKIYRRDTIQIDFKPVPQRPLAYSLHVIASEQLGLIGPELITIEFDSYKHKAYYKLTSLLIAERVIRHCKGSIKYEVNSELYELEVSIVNDRVLPLSVFTVPF